MSSTAVLPSWIGSAAAAALPSRGAVFLADLHLGAGWGDPAREEMVCRLLAQLNGTVEDLILGGDSFEFWYEWRHVEPFLGRRFLAELERQAEQRRVWMIRGNHDFALGKKIESRGIRVLENGLCLDLSGQRWLFLHGDGMAPSDRLDRLVRRVLRHPVSQWAYRHLLHPDLAMGIALRTGRTSREIHPGPAPNIAEYETAAFFWMESLHLSGVVHAHTHRPLMRRRGEYTYVNCGDWCHRRSLVRIGNGEAVLEDWT